MLLFLSASGVQEKNGFSQCGYAVDEVDSNPASNYHKLPDGCKMSNGIGICAFVTLLLTLYAVFNVSAERKPQSDPLLTGADIKQQV